MFAMRRWQRWRWGSGSNPTIPCVLVLSRKGKKLFPLARLHPDCQTSFCFEEEQESHILHFCNFWNVYQFLNLSTGNNLCMLQICTFNWNYKFVFVINFTFHPNSRNLLPPILGHQFDFGPRYFHLQLCNLYSPKITAFLAFGLLYFHGFRRCCVFMDFHVVVFSWISLLLYFHGVFRGFRYIFMDFDVVVFPWNWMLL